MQSEKDMLFSNPKLKLSEEEFEEFVSYVESICERSDLIGAAAHTVDVLKKN